MGNTAKTIQDGTGLRIEGLGGLSRSAKRLLRERPNQARMVVAAALEAAAAQYEFDRDSGVADVPDSLKPFVVRRPRGPDMLGVSDAAIRLGVSRTTVYDWVEKGTLLGWRSTRRGLTIPAEQVLGPGKVVPGIARVRDIIGDPELAWAFLSQDWPFADQAARPIDKLKAGAVDEVAGAAAGFGMTVT